MHNINSFFIQFSASFAALQRPIVEHNFHGLILMVLSLCCSLHCLIKHDILDLQFPHFQVLKIVHHNIITNVGTLNVFLIHGTYLNCMYF